MDQNTQQEIDRLFQVADDFNMEMKARLREQAIKGIAVGMIPIITARFAR